MSMQLGHSSIYNTSLETKSEICQHVGLFIAFAKTEGEFPVGSTSTKAFDIFYPPVIRSSTLLYVVNIINDLICISFKCD